MSVRVLARKELVQLSVAIYRVIADNEAPDEGFEIEHFWFVFTEYDVDLIDDVLHWMVEYGALVKTGGKFSKAPDASASHPF